MIGGLCVPDKIPVLHSQRKYRENNMSFNYFMSSANINRVRSVRVFLSGLLALFTRNQDFSLSHWICGLQSGPLGVRGRFETSDRYFVVGILWRSLRMDSSKGRE